MGLHHSKLVLKVAEIFRWVKLKLVQSGSTVSSSASIRGDSCNDDDDGDGDDDDASKRCFSVTLGG